MADEKPRCPHCGSADTVSYWDIKDHRNDNSIIGVVYRHYYPNARKCVDCGEVWW